MGPPLSGRSASTRPLPAARSENPITAYSCTHNPTTAPTACLPHTGFAGVWTPAIHAELNDHRTMHMTRIATTYRWLGSDKSALFLSCLSLSIVSRTPLCPPWRACLSLRIVTCVNCIIAALRAIWWSPPNHGHSCRAGCTIRTSGQFNRDAEKVSEADTRRRVALAEIYLSIDSNSRGYRRLVRTESTVRPDTAHSAHHQCTLAALPSPVQSHQHALWVLLLPRLSFALPPSPLLSCPPSRPNIITVRHVDALTAIIRGAASALALASKLEAVPRSNDQRRYMPASLVSPFGRPFPATNGRNRW